MKKPTTPICAEPLTYAVGELHPDSKWYYPPHSHRHHELIFILEGRMTVRTPEGEETATSGDLLLYRSGLTHEEFADSAKPVHSLFIGFFYPFSAPPPLKLHDSAGRVRQLMQWMRALRMDTSDLGCRQKSLWFQALIAEVERLCLPEAHPLVTRVHNFVEAEIDGMLSLGRIARHIEMNPSAFLRKYKKLTGRTPMDDVRRLRAERARDYLLSTRLPLKSIAPKVGIANEYHLSRILKQHFDLTPGQIRRGLSTRNA